MSADTSSRAVEIALALERSKQEKQTREAKLAMAKVFHEAIRYLAGLKPRTEGDVLVGDLLVDDASRERVQTFLIYLEEQGFMDASNAEEVKSLPVAAFLADLKGLEYTLNGGYEPQSDSATLAAGITEKSHVDATSVLRDVLSDENMKFLNDSNRKNEYEARLKTLSEEELRGCPSFADLMEQVKKISNKTLDALRKRTKDLRFVVAVLYDDEHRITAYRPGLIEATEEPEFLRDTANPENFTGAHYDMVYRNLEPHGLRSPNFTEYKALFAMRKKMDGVSIDQNTIALLDMGKRRNKQHKVSLVRGLRAGASQCWDDPTSPNDILVSRASAWGGDVLPKTA